jgi:hypothetical protein
MNEPHAAPPEGAGPRYSPDGRWLWDGQRWTPVPNTGQSAVIQPPRDIAQAPPETARPARSGISGLALGLGIGAIVAGVLAWFFSFTFAVNRVDDTILGLVLVAGFVAGVLAVMLALGPSTRPRGGGQIAALACGLIGLGVLLLFTAFAVINYP